MSKQRTSILLSLCIAFALAIYGFVAAMTYVVKAESVDASVSRLIDVDTLANGDGDAKVTFVINKNLGTASFTDSEVAGVTYTTADGTRTVSGVTYYFDTTAVLPRIQISFAEDSVSDGAVQYAEGDTISFTTDFSFSNEDGSKTFTLGEAVTVTYTGGEWTGSFVGDAISASDVTVNHNVAVFLSGGCIQFDFGYSNVQEGDTLLDVGSGWLPQGSIGGNLANMYDNHIMFTSFGGWDATRYVLHNGTVAIGDASSHASSGSILTLKAGMVIYQATGTRDAISGNQYLTSASCYTPLAILGSNLSFKFDGSQWAPAPAATSATLSNADMFEDFGTGQSLQLEWTFGEGEYELPIYTSSDPAVATVDSNGLVKGVSDGNVTITAHFSGFDKEIEITVGEPAEVTSFRFDIKGAATRDGKQFLVAYVGEELDKTFAASRLTAVPVYSNGVTGESFAVTADMISLDKFSNAQEGETAITVTSEAYPGVSSDVPVYVYEVHEVNDYVAPSRLLSRSDSSINIYLFDVVDDNQGESQNVQIIDFRNYPEYGITKEIATMVEPSWVENPAQHELYTVGEITQIQMLVYFGGFYSDGDYKIPAGTVLTFTEDFRMYRPIDGTWVAYYKFPGEAKYVWDGSAWQNFVAEATGFTLEETEVTLPNGATYAPKVAVAPSGAYGEVSFAITSGSEYITVEDGAITAVAPGTATIEISMGKLSGTQTITVTVKDTEAAGIVLDNDRTFHLSEDDTALKLGNIDVKIDYGDGYYSDVISLDKSAVTVGKYTLDTSVGTHTVSLDVTINDNGVDISDTIEIETEVHEVIEVYPDNMNIPMDPNFWGETLFLIYFQKTFPNTANVYASALGADGKNVTDYMQYIRADGTEATINNPGFLQNMLGFDVHVGNQYIGVDKNESGDSYLAAQDGDKIILKKGMCFYRWFGDEDSNHNVTGDGDYVKVGELAYDVVFEYSQGQNAFNYTIAPVDGVVLEETVSIGLGQQHAANVQTIPSYATHGEWFYEVADEKVATVSVSGMITGKAIGSTTVTAELRYNDAVIKSVSFTVTVTDSVTGLQITSSKPLAVDLGTEMDIAGWISEFGITARAVYASGTVGTDAIDLTDARVTGYDAETEGQQTLTFRVTVDGRSVTGTITITVGAAGSNEKGGGCSSAVAGTGIVAAAGLLFAGAAVLCLKKKKD